MNPFGPINFKYIAIGHLKFYASQSISQSFSQLIIQKDLDEDISVIF